MPKIITAHKCKACGQEFTPKKGTLGIYCCYACSGKGRRGHRKPFWDFVLKQGSGCWLWEGASFGKRGYGLYSKTGAHRYSWRIHFGDIPKGMYVCHRCDVKLCVRPDHLFLGTAMDNAKDMVAKNRSPKTWLGVSCVNSPRWKFNMRSMLAIMDRRKQEKNVNAIARFFGTDRKVIFRVIAYMESISPTITSPASFE